MHIGMQEESLFASLSIWIIIVIPAPWNFDQWEDRVYLHVTCINNFGPFRNFAVWMRTAPTIKSISGYVCNHGSLRVGNETLRPLGVAMGNAVSVTRVWSIHTKTPPVGRRQPMTSLPARPQYKGAPGKYVIHFFVWSLRPKHGTTPRGRSVSFPTLREPWLHT